MIHGGVIRFIGNSIIITTDNLKNPSPYLFAWWLCCNMKKTDNLKKGGRQSGGKGLDLPVDKSG